MCAGRRGRAAAQQHMSALPPDLTPDLSRNLTPRPATPRHALTCRPCRPGACSSVSATASGLSPRMLAITLRGATWVLRGGEEVVNSKPRRRRGEVLHSKPN